MGMHLADLGRPTLPCGAAFSGGKRVGESVSIFYSLHSTQIELLKPVQLLKGSVTSNYYPCSGQVMKVKSISSKGLQGTVSSFMIRAIGRKYCTCNQVMLLAMLPAIHEPKRQRYAS